MKTYSDVGLVNIGAGEDMTILGLAELVAETVGHRGRLVFDPTKPDRSPRKWMVVSRIAALGWSARTGMREGFWLAYRDFLSSPRYAAVLSRGAAS